MNREGKNSANKAVKKTTKKAKSTKPAKNITRPLQLASKTQLLEQNLDDVTPIVQFLEDFRNMLDPRARHKSKLISIKIPEPMLAAFKYKASQAKITYQTMIKTLMVEWLSGSR
jgi:predicted DNA binding CopG/RHH family protein